MHFLLFFLSIAYTLLVIHYAISFKKINCFLITLFILFITSLIYTFLIYKEKIDISTAGIYRTSFIIGAIIFFIYGLLTGITEKKKGFLSSFISTFIIIAIIIIVKLLSKQSFQPTNLIKYGVYLLTSVVGGILGVNLTSKSKKNVV